MVYSMSGFGRSGRIVVDPKSRRETNITLEMKSVNSKSIDVFIKCSSRFSFLEEWMRSIVRERLSRGKIDISFHIAGVSEDILSADFDALDRVDALFRTIEKRYRLKRTKDLRTYLNTEGVLVHKRTEPEADVIKEMVEGVLEEAISALKEMRLTEGRHLEMDLDEKLRKMESLLDEIDEERPRVVNAKFETMKRRMEAMIGDKVDEQMILQEVALFAEKVDIEEEIVRLRTHIKHMRSLFELEEPIGRKLDFISQELLREANTIGSKSPDEKIIGSVIEMKSLIDRIKEQVQNIL